MTIYKSKSEQKDQEEKRNKGESLLQVSTDEDNEVCTQQG